jgi:glutamate/aspartate transport system substrate-binding protein
LRDETVVLTAGTTNETAVRVMSDKQKLGIKLLIGADHDQSFQILIEGRRAALRAGGDDQVRRSLSYRRRLPVL